jgi:hypothetical protein
MALAIDIHAKDFVCRCHYSSFGIGVDRKHKLKCLFPQEKGTSDELVKFTCIPRLLLEEAEAFDAEVDVVDGFAGCKDRGA